MHTSLNLALLFVTTGALTCCGGSSTAPPALLTVGGNYDVLKTTTSDTCSASIAAPVTTPSSVTHAAGSTSFTLIDHGTRALPGQVARDGTMTMPAATSVVQGTISATDTFANGRFSTTGFDVTVTTDLSDHPSSPGTGACRIVATWHGTKAGTPNVIPG
jgi:hypothetical protein